MARFPLNSLQKPVLVLNKNWQPVHVATVARALILLWKDAARVVDAADYQTFSWEDWSKLRPRDGDAFMSGVNFRLRVPEVVTLTDAGQPLLGANASPGLREAFETVLRNLLLPSRY